MANEGATTDINEEGAAENVLEGDILTPVSGSTLAVLHGTEVNQQVATAKRFPRDHKEIAATIRSLATLDEDTAEECIYALPRGGKHIRGPSARFADILINTWGNARSASYITAIDKDAGHVEAVGMFYDIQRNVARQRSIKRRILDKNGRVYNDDMILMTCNAATSIAERNAILAGVPKPLWVHAYNAAFALVAGTTATLTEKRDRALAAFAKLGISTEQVLSLIRKPSVEKIEVDDIPVLRGVLQAIRNGEETIASVFGSSGPREGQASTSPLKDPSATTDARAAAAAEAAQNGKPAAETKAEPTKPDATKPTTPAAEPPKTIVEYIASATAWIAADPPEGLRARWAQERALRGTISKADRPLEEDELLKLTRAIDARAGAA